MPTSSLRHVTFKTPFVQTRNAGLSYRPPMPLIGPWMWEACGMELFAYQSGSFTSSAYPATSRVVAYMFTLADYFLVRKVWWVNGTTATTDSADCGVYTEDGLTRIVSGGSTPIATANVVQEIDCTDTLLAPGRYWCAYVQGGTTATPMAATTSALGARFSGWAQMAGSGSTLGTTFTPAAYAGTVVPLFGIANRTQVA